MKIHQMNKNGRAQLSNGITDPLHGAGSRCNPCTENMCICVQHQSSDIWLWFVLIVMEDIWMLLTVAKSVRSIRARCVRSMRVQDPKEGTQNALDCTEFKIIYLSLIQITFRNTSFQRRLQTIEF